jgi:ATP/maltotriose-dependent transcriptional regulator MalT
VNVYNFLPNAILGTIFIGIQLFIFYLYTRLTKDNLPADIKNGEYTKIVQLLSRRELEAVEAVLAGNFSYKELSVALNISVHVVKTLLKHI